MAIIAFRADNQLEKDLENAARSQKRTKTEIIREALAQYLERLGADKSSAARHRGASSIEKFIGVWDGPEDSSVGAGRKLGDYLIDSQRSRRM